MPWACLLSLGVSYETSHLALRVWHVGMAHIFGFSEGCISLLAVPRMPPALFTAQLLLLQGCSVLAFPPSHTNSLFLPISLIFQISAQMKSELRNI